MKDLSLSLVVIILCLIITSCKKESSPEPEKTIYANDTFLRYWYFPKGSYWIYEKAESQSQIIDSAVVVLAKRRISYNPTYSPYEFENHILHIQHHSRYFGASNQNTFKQILRQINDVNRVRTQSDIYEPINLSGIYNSGAYFIWPPNSEEIFKYSRGSTQLIEYIESREVLGFTEVYKLASKNDVVYNSQNTDTFWIKENVGLIQYYFAQDNALWKLKEYKIQTE